MNRILLFTGGVLSLSMAIFKIAMPFVFGWREAMGPAAASMWSILLAENLGISLLLLFFAAMSIFNWRQLLETGLGRTVLLSIGSLWVFRTIAEVVLFKIGVDGAWWRVFLFLALALIYLIPIFLTGKETL